MFQGLINALIQFWQNILKMFGLGKSSKAITPKTTLQVYIKTNAGEQVTFLIW